MKKIMKIISALALSVALSLGVATAAYAAVVYEAEEVVIAGTGEYTETDLFGNFKNVMPGDDLQQSIEVSNANGTKVKVFLRAVAYDEEGNPLTYSESFEEADGKDQASHPEEGIGGEGQRDESVASMKDFLAQLRMTVSVGGAVVFDDAPCEEGGLAENVFLGELFPDESLVLDVNMHVPIEMSSDYMNRVGEVNWVFVVEDYGDPDEEDTGDENDDLEGDHDDDDEDGSEGGSKPGGKDDPSLPDGPLSQTGDSILPIAAFGVMFVAGVVLAAARRRGGR